MGKHGNVGRIWGQPSQIRHFMTTQPRYVESVSMSRQTTLLEGIGWPSVRFRP